MEITEKTENEIVRVERSSDSLPIWAPSQYGKQDRREYRLEWISENARVVVQKAGEYGLLRWQDKLVLAALVQFWNNQGRSPEGWVSFTINDISNLLWGKSGGSQAKQLKSSLWRLRGCLIQHHNSFYSKEKGGYVSRTQGVNILNYLTLYKYKSQAGDEIETTQIQLNLDLVQNLIGNYTRPVSLDLWLQLSERGGLFESYVNSVLYKNPRIQKDIFDLWEQLGLSTRGIEYGSKLANKMKPELDKMCDDPYGLLREYAFEKSKSKPKSQNLILYRREIAYVDKQSPENESQLTLNLNTCQLTPNELDIRIEQIRFELGDKSTEDKNIRRIVERMPKGTIDQAITDAVGRVKDGQVRRAVPYFVGRMKKEAEQSGIDLGFRPAKRKPEPLVGSIEPQKATPKKATGSQEKPEPSTGETRAKIDTYYLSLTEAEKTRLQETAALKATVLLSSDSKGFDALVRENIRLMIAEKLRIKWEG